MSRPPAAIDLATRAAREVRGLERPVRRRVQRALESLATDAANLDIKPVTGQPPWQRLRVGGHRILFRDGTLKGGPRRYVVGRIVDRRDLQRAINSLG